METYFKTQPTFEGTDAQDMFHATGRELEFLLGSPEYPGEDYPRVGCEFAGELEGDFISVWCAKRDLPKSKKQLHQWFCWSNSVYAGRRFRQRLDALRDKGSIPNRLQICR